MNKHPQLRILHQLFLSESQLFRKVYRLIQLFESNIKIHTVHIKEKKRNGVVIFIATRFTPYKDSFPLYFPGIWMFWFQHQTEPFF